MTTTNDIVTNLLHRNDEVAALSRAHIFAVEYLKKNVPKNTFVFPVPSPITTFNYDEVAKTQPVPAIHFFRGNSDITDAELRHMNLGPREVGFTQHFYCSIVTEREQLLPSDNTYKGIQDSARLFSLIIGLLHGWMPFGGDYSSMFRLNTKEKIHEMYYQGFLVSTLDFYIDNVVVTFNGN